MRVLVTGATGQVGTEAARVLAASGHAVSTFDRATLDLADPASIVRVLRATRPEVVVNAGAYTAVDRAESEPAAAHAVNAEAPGVIAAECRALDALLLHLSTDYVFDGRKPAPYVETDAVGPLNEYGRGKLAGERAIAQSGCDHLILRTSWVYGPHGANFLRTMLDAARKRDELRVVDDQRGAPTSSVRLGRLVADLLSKGRETLRAGSGLYHATATGATTWFGFAEAIFAGNPGAPRLVPIASSEWPTPARRPANSQLDSGKLDSTFHLGLGDWREGLAEVRTLLAGA